MDAWHYQSAGDLDASLMARLQRCPREPDMLVYGLRTTAAVLLRSWLRLYHGLSIAGRGHLPADESYMMVANHTSHLDTLCLLSALPYRRLHASFPAAAHDYFFKNVPRTAIAAVVVNALPFHRDVHIRQSLSLCRELLARPRTILIIFPEGTRSTDGRLQPFKPGIGLLLAGSDVPVVPCHLRGAHDAWPKGCVLPRPRRLHLEIGAPRRYASLKPGKQSALRIGAELEDAVRDLSRTAVRSEGAPTPITEEHHDA